MYENRRITEYTVTNSYSQITDKQQIKPNDTKLDSAKGPLILFGSIWYQTEPILILAKKVFSGRKQGYQQLMPRELEHKYF